MLLDGFDAGAIGFVLKDEPLPDVVRAVRMMADGRTYIAPTLAGGLLSGSVLDQPRLSGRERQILQLLADGHATEEVGEILCISIQTVRAHLRNAMSKLQSHSRTHAIATALRTSVIR